MRRSLSVLLVVAMVVAMLALAGPALAQSEVTPVSTGVNVILDDDACAQLKTSGSTALEQSPELRVSRGSGNCVVAASPDQ